MVIIEQLEAMRSSGGAARTTGLSNDIIRRFAEQDPKLVEAVGDAAQIHQALSTEMPEFLALDEDRQIEVIQSDYVNFYSADTVNPYVICAARGPWIVTLKGAVLHDTGGYGMLGFGHAPEDILQAMNQTHAMANVMTPNISQHRMIEALRKEIGQQREQGCPFEKFLCMNSGSEAMTVAARISDVNAKLMTDPGGRYANNTIRAVGLKSGFHGRTDRPAQFSDSTRQTYTRHLATFRDRDNLITVEPNDLEQLEQVFHYADKNDMFIEALFVEPVMGEGNPGLAITAEFYTLARQLTEQHGSLLIVDSIQAGIRAHGLLSIVDYPGFEDLDPPDMESYSKALNAGQYPLSVLAMTDRATALYRKGIYGNTMTTNPRALDVACAVLAGLTPEIRDNIRHMGQAFVDRFEQLAKEMPGIITKVQGTGLLFSVELDSCRFKGFGTDSIEEYMRIKGVNVIHGGVNSLRFTPHFAVTDMELELIVDATRQALLAGPQKAAASEAA